MDGCEILFLNVESNEKFKLDRVGDSEEERRRVSGGPHYSAGRTVGLVSRKLDSSLAPAPGHI